MNLPANPALKAPMTCRNGFCSARVSVEGATCEDCMAENAKKMGNEKDAKKPGSSEGAREAVSTGSQTEKQTEETVAKAQGPAGSERSGSTSKWRNEWGATAVPAATKSRPPVREAGETPPAKLPKKQVHLSKFVGKGGAPSVKKEGPDEEDNTSKNKAPGKGPNRYQQHQQDQGQSEWFKDAEGNIRCSQTHTIALTRSEVMKNNCESSDSSSISVDSNLTTFSQMSGARAPRGG